MAIVDVVKCDFAPNVLAWKFPSSELSSWTQLIVSESQEALLLKEGKAVGPFSAGRHVLSSDNYPLLNSLLKIPFGRSPYTAEVWFVQKAFNLSIKWGTPTAMQLEDPKYHIMLPVRAFGQYGVAIDNCAKFLIKLNGTLPAFTTSTLTSYFKGIIATQTQNLISQYLVQKEISILHIAAHLDEISNHLQEKLSQFTENYGIKIVNFAVNSITTDENDPAVKKLREVLAAKLEMDVLGFNYQQKRSFDTMETAAGNSSSNGLLGAGIGLGMGVGFGVPMGNFAQQMTQNMGAAAMQPNMQYHNVATQAHNSPDQDFKEKAGNPEGIKCNVCGAISAPGSKFCPNCGDIFFLCPVCGTDNPVTAEFCTQCHAPLPLTCSKCGSLNPASSTFCTECGNALGSSCPKCGKIVSRGKKFCPDCGTKMETPQS